MPKYQPEWFERFWKLYPRRTNRKPAVKAWDKLKPSRELCDVMSAALKEQIQSEQWQDPQHIPHPSTWLNNARWADEMPGRKAAGPPTERKTAKIFIDENGEEAVTFD